MKYFGLYLLMLLSFANTKEEDDDYDYDNLPPEAIDYIKNDEICREAELDQNLCFSKTSLLTNKKYQCCMLDLKIEGEPGEVSCSLLGGTLEEINNLKNSQKIKAIIKESYGFFEHGLKTIFESEDEEYYPDDMTFPKIRQHYKCQKGDIELLYGYDNYTASEIELFESKKHCLYHFYHYLNMATFKPPTADDCYQAKILQSSLDNGLECGYYQFNIKFLTGESEIYKTCYLFNTDVIKDKRLDENSQGYFQTLAMNIANAQGKASMSYTVEFSDAKGNKLKFDSLTQKVTSSSVHLTINNLKNYIFLLFLLFL